ncbi:hypothetical protein GCM10009827_079990 [Dactylosporangium maewongense]|uniref:Uncharacterized protein n=1 Tax=Dactylosporangium maewongense TaxID=634393 RepID=A0ABN2BVK0_9ACTN
MQQRYYIHRGADGTSGNRTSGGDFLAGDIHHPSRTGPVDVGQFICHDITLTAVQWSSI